ncbi:hypothetical protein AGLY_006116 [Aphis glycines]|uniref:Uncharacterized protein n=1 Tax=Aphis glycines TaxID=307491 RepID=A0A6G0TSZ8_APHGL|nr:hypothetical protein AGLY_006116 [Aphis glycines]
MNKLIFNNNNNILILLMMDDDDDKVSSFSYLTSKKRKTTNVIFKNHKSECFKILINRHLINNQVKFRQYFRINYEQFNFLLLLVEEKLSVEPTNRVKNPILPTKKHDSVTLSLNLLIILKLCYEEELEVSSYTLNTKLHNSLPIFEIFTQILTLKSDSEAIKSSSSRVAEEAVGQTVRVVVVVVSSIIIFEINCPFDESNSSKRESTDGRVGIFTTNLVNQGVRGGGYCRPTCSKVLIPPRAKTSSGSLEIEPGTAYTQNTESLRKDKPTLSDNEILWKISVPIVLVGPQGLKLTFQSCEIGP